MNNSPLNIINLIGPLPINSDLVDKNLFTILIDGGKNHALPVLNTLSVGDQDSSDLDLDILLAREKDASDLNYALEHIPKNTKQVYCYGLLGGRLDHQLCILGDICHYIENKLTTFEFFTTKEKQLLIFPAGNWVIPYQGTFSVLSLYQQEISISGDVQYPLGVNKKELINPMRSMTLSNEAFGHIQIQCQRPLAIFLAT